MTAAGVAPPQSWPSPHHVGELLRLTEESMAAQKELKMTTDSLLWNVGRLSQECQGILSAQLDHDSLIAEICSIGGSVATGHRKQPSGLTVTAMMGFVELLTATILGSKRLVPADVDNIDAAAAAAMATFMPPTTTERRSPAEQFLARPPKQSPFVEPLRQAGTPVMPSRWQQGHEPFLSQMATLAPELSQERHPAERYTKMSVQAMRANTSTPPARQTMTSPGPIAPSFNVPPQRAVATLQSGMCVGPETVTMLSKSCLRNGVAEAGAAGSIPLKVPARVGRQMNLIVPQVGTAAPEAMGPERVGRQMISIVAQPAPEESAAMGPARVGRQMSSIVPQPAPEESAAMGPQRVGRHLSTIFPELAPEEPAAMGPQQWATTESVSGQGAGLISAGVAESKSKIRSLPEGLTTVVVRNLPPRCTQEELIEQFFPADGTYDYLHIPYNLLQKRPLGYAFLNFVSHELAVEFQQQWHGRFLQGLKHDAKDALDIAVADVQGRDQNLMHVKAKKASQLERAGFLPAVFEGSKRLNTRQLLADMGIGKCGVKKDVGRSSQAEHGFDLLVGERSTFGEL